jgi:uncharacterized protein
MTLPETTEMRVLTKESWRGLILAGARRVIANREHLDRINVFPVPDRDTGTNLALTMRAIIDALQAPQPSLAAVSSTVATSALTGAQGNSGVIFAQFFQGLREEIPDSVSLSMQRFAEALRCAATRAREALAQPREGTILTVISDVSDYVARHVDKFPGFRTLLDEGLAIARRSLETTTDRLAELKRAGVVDAGAMGFVHFMEGLRDFLRSPNEETLHEPPVDTLPEKPAPATVQFSFRYCTEAVVFGHAIDRRETMARLAEFGDSIVVAGDQDEIHAHVHTNAPAYVLDVLAQQGTIVSHKVEDMLESVEVDGSPCQEPDCQEIALVTDSACDLPMRFLTERHVHVVPVRVVFGDTMFLDRVDLSSRGFYQRLQSSEELPKTSQPAPADFQKLYRYLASTHKSILSVHLSAGLSGTYQSAVTAAREVSKETGVPIAVIDSQSASSAEGLVVWAAAEAARAGLTAAQCTDIANQAAQAAKVFVYVPSIDNFVKGGRLSPLQGRIARLLRILPILTSQDGKLVPAIKAFGRRGARRRTIQHALHAARDVAHPFFIVSHAAAADLAAATRETILQRRPDAEVWITDTAPAIGSHSGPGGLAIAVLDAERTRKRIRDKEMR